MVENSAAESQENLADYQEPKNTSSEPANSLKKKSQLDLEAAEEVNDDDGLNTSIEGTDAIPIKVKKNSEAPQEISSSTSANQQQSSSVKGGQDLIFKTAEGAQKRLHLPIESIKEDFMDDPEAMLEEAGDGDEIDEEERAKILSALQEMQKEKNQTTEQINRKLSAEVPLAVVDVGAESTDSNLGSLEHNQESMEEDNDNQILNADDDAGEPVSAARSSLAESPDKNLKGNSYNSLKESSGQKSAIETAQTKQGLASKRRYKGKKGKVARKGNKQGSELEKKAATLNEDGGVLETEENEIGGGDQQEEIEDVAPVDPALFFEQIKQRFYQQETQLNDAEQLKELEKLEAERKIKEAAEEEQKAKDEEKRKQEEEEAKFQTRIYGPGGRFGRTPNMAAIEAALQQQAKTKRLARQKERDERRAKLLEERRAQGEDINEEDIIAEESEEVIDYEVEMQEEELVPEGQEAQLEQERVIGDRPMKQIVRNQGRIVKIVPESTLPKKLPDNLVFWNKCEFRVESTRLLSYSQVQNFHKAKLVQFEDKEANEKVMKQYPIIDNLEIWADSQQEKFVNNHEKAIFNMRKYPKGIKEFVTEGYIKFERIRSHDCFFNASFESGNLRQVFKVPVEVDFDWIPVEEKVPNYLPEEIQQEHREVIKKQKIKDEELRKQMIIEEEKEEEAELKQPIFERKKKKEEKKLEEEKENNPDLDDVKSNKNKESDDEQKDSDDSDISNKNKGQKAKKKKKKKERPKPTCEYNLYLQDDTNADSALFQWYYFSVMNIKAETHIRLNINNLSKPNGLYAKGMKPFVYSMNKKKSENIGWHRGGENVHYFLNGHQARFSKKTLDAHFISDGTDPVGKDNYKQLHSLSFDYKFESDYDIVFFAHFQPYTYNDLMNFLCGLQAKESNADKMRVDYICNSLGKTPIYGLTITNNIQHSYVPQGKEIFKFQRYEYKNAIVKPKKVKYLEKEVIMPDGDDSIAKSSDEELPSPIEQQLEIEEQKETGQTASVSQFDPSSIKGPEVAAEAVTTDNQATPAAADVSQQEPQKTTTQAVAAEIEGASAQQPQSPSLVGISIKPLQENEGSEGEDDSKHEKTPQSKGAESPMLGVKKGKKGKKGLNDSRYKKKFGHAAKEKEEDRDEKPYKKHIFITSRVHPGESQASHLVHGLIQYLLSDEDEAKEIRDKFVIKVIPMINPDGVIHGNYRVSLLGVDLNRRWKKPSKFLHPEVYYTKALIKYFNEKSKQPDCDSGGVVLCCDMHGHSRNMDLFMYSCVDHDSIGNNMIIKATPVGVDRTIPLFNMKNCNFAMEKDKANTARIVIYKEIGILSSYTLESTFYGSEFFKRPKHGAALLTKDQQDYQSERYGVSYTRKDISIDFDACILMGADFIRGMNFASKKKPLLQYWFRNPPKNIIEVFKPVVKGEEDGRDEIDPVLLELEKAWRPVGHVDQDKKLGIGERFDQGENMQLPRTPPEDTKKKKQKVDKLDIGLQDKLKKQKKLAAKNRKRALQDAKAGDKAHADGKKLESGKLNDDLADVQGKASKQRNKAYNKSGIKVGPLKMSTSRKRLESPKKRSQHGSRKIDSSNKNKGELSHASLDKKSSHHKSIEKIAKQESEYSQRKVPITLREPGNTFQDDFDDSDEDQEDDELRVSQLVFSKNQGIQLSQQLKENEEFQRGSSSEDGHQQEYLLSKALGSVTKSKDSRRKESSRISNAGSDSSPRSKRQLNLSVRVKEGKAVFKEAALDGTLALARIDSQFDDNVESEERIESRLLIQKNKQSDGFSQGIGKSQYRVDDEYRAMEQLNKVSDFTLQQEQQMLDQLEMKKKNLTQQVSAEELDDLMIGDLEGENLSKLTQMRARVYAQITPEIQDTFRKNRLSVDPVCLPATKLEALAQIQMKTLEKEQKYQSLKSPRKLSKKSGKKSPYSKGVFAPQNAVYNQTQLLANPQLAQAQGINFYVQNNQSMLNANHMQMLTLKQQLGFRNKEEKSRQGQMQRLAMNQSLSPQSSAQRLQFQVNTSDMRKNLLSPELNKDPSKIGLFQKHNMSTAGLLQHSLTNQSSVNTIQTVVASGANFDQGFSIGDYVNEQISQLEKTKVQVASKIKKNKQHKMVNLKSPKAYPVYGSSGQAKIILPNIQKAVKMTNNQMNRDSQSTKKHGSLVDLGSLGMGTNTEGQSQQTSSKYVRNHNIESLNVIDGHQSVEFPPLSPHTVKEAQTPSVSVPMKKYLEVKDGFNFANNCADRQQEKLIDLKHTQALRERQRRMSKPQFVIKPLDQRDYLNIQMQNVVDDKMRSRNNHKRGGSLNNVRPSKVKMIDSQNHLDSALGTNEREGRQSTQLLQPQTRRTMSVGEFNSPKQTTQPPQQPIQQLYSPIANFATTVQYNNLNSNIQQHPSMLASAYQSSPPPQLARATMRKEIKQREVKSMAVHNMVNQTMVVNNQLLLFKPN